MTYDDRFERDLDAWWDADVLGDPPPPTTTALESEIETISAIHASDAPAVPTPAFATSLKVELIMTARALQAPDRPHAVPPYFRQLKTYALPAAGPSGPPRATAHLPRRRFVPAAIVALLLVGMLGAAYGGGALDRFSNKSTSIPAILGSNPATTPIPATTSATANFRGDASRSGQMPGPAPVGAPTLVWKNTGLTAGGGSPVIDDGKIFTVLSSGGSNVQYPYFLKAIDLLTGADLWTISLDATFDGVPAAGNGLVYVISSAGLIAFNEADGSQVWNYPTGTLFIMGRTPALANGALYFMVGDGTVRALDAKTGSDRWNVPVSKGETDFIAKNGGYGASNSLAVADGVVYGTDVDGLVFARSADDGRLLWTFQTEGRSNVAPMIVDGTVFVSSIIYKEGASGTPGRLNALDAKTGKQRWAAQTFGSSFSLTAGDGKIFLNSTTPYGIPLTAIDANSGRELWTVKNGSMSGDPIFSDGGLFASGGDGSIQELDPNTGAVTWSVYLGAASPAIVDHMLIVSGYQTMFAIGGDGNAAAPAASPPVDFSGRSVCTPPGAVPTAKFTEKPAHTIDAETELKTRPGKPPTWEDGRPTNTTEWPQLLTENIPTGPAASQTQTAEIQKTLDEMTSCSARAGGDTLLEGFFTADFYRRGVVSFNSFGYTLWWQLQPEASNIASTSAVTLDDGRIGVLIATLQGPGSFIVFTQQDGHWMVDEAYKVVDQYDWSQQG